MTIGLTLEKRRTERKGDNAEHDRRQEKKTPNRYMDGWIERNDARGLQELHEAVLDRTEWRSMACRVSYQISTM